MKRRATVFLSGVLFAVGLAMSGMTHPSKVLAFLDVAGKWDPSLILVMVSAIGVSAIAFRMSEKRTAARGTPLFGERFHVASRTSAVTPALVIGSVLFGAGWGLSGLCPGPALTLLVTGALGPILFVVAMIAGMALQDLAVRKWATLSWSKAPSARAERRVPNSVT